MSKFSTIIYSAIAKSIEPGGRYYDTLNNAISAIADRALERTIVKIEQMLCDNEKYAFLKAEYMIHTVDKINGKLFNDYETKRFIEKTIQDTIRTEIIVKLGKVSISAKSEK